MFDSPFGLKSNMGMRVIEAAEHPRYTLPADVPPPTGMTRAEFDAWSRRVCGMVSPIPRGTAYFFNGCMVIHPRDAVMLTNIGA